MVRAVVSSIDATALVMALLSADQAKLTLDRMLEYAAR